MKESLIIRLVSAGLMIIAGTVIYIVSRQDIIFFNWIPESIIDIEQPYTMNCDSMPEYFVVYCFPDGLWYGALLLFQSAFRRNTFTSKSIYWTSIILPFAWELLQIHDEVPGTFDSMDMSVYFLVLTIFIICSKTKICSKVKEALSFKR